MARPRGGVRKAAEAYLAAHPAPDSVTGPELAAHLGHKSPSSATKALRDIRAATGGAQAGAASGQGAPGKTSRPRGVAQAEAAAYLDSAPDPEKVTGPELARHMGYRSPGEGYRMLRQWRLARGLPVAPSPNGAAPAEPARAVERAPARRVPDVLQAVLGQFGGQLSGEELAGLLLPVPGLHNQGVPIVRDRAGQAYELHLPGAVTAASR